MAGCLVGSVLKQHTLFNNHNLRSEGNDIKCKPVDLKLAIGAGIGFFLAFIGLKGSGIIVANPDTFIAMGSILSAPALLAVIGIIITLILYIKKVPAAVFIGLVLTSIIGVIFTLCGFGVGDVTMPTIPAHAISLNFDTSVFGQFMNGFGNCSATYLIF